MKNTVWKIYFRWQALIIKRNLNSNIYVALGNYIVKDIIGKILITLVSIVITIFVGILFIKTNPTLNEIYENQKDLLEVKIGSIIGNKVEDPSINIRDDKLLIEKETGLKIDFKRSKNTFRGVGLS